ncbi:hypothetical protein MCOR07_009273 [Pyricularia oryzae]|nr:hypothetical protein MCOR26_005210 [Pyricularia oryzae]KAI6393217.1 hypothetical protein MCOR20_010889 [Pyricularia oryzae]KAI6394177.1 hypothetical protein MCOR23_007630 [Pyricularia oryzae]KAI6580891.1 hypothetical protein MCOR12_011519 [Pyricularia oryzae]KAI6613241.1 hypothetical protein MCOR07_009273 [Pyricularia oryzae]
MRLAPFFPAPWPCSCRGSAARPCSALPVWSPRSSSCGTSSRTSRQGYAITKTSIFIGLIEGAALKLFTTIVTLGHDDLMVATGRFIQSLKQGVDWLKYHASIEVPHVQALSAAKVGELDKHYRMSHPTIKGIAEGVSKPVEKTQELLGLDTAKVLASPGTGQGWHADGTKVVEQVLVAGAVQVATEKIVDAVTQKPYDACVDRRHKK